MYVCMYAYVCACVCVYIYIYMYLSLSIYIYIYIYIYVHVHVHVACLGSCLCHVCIALPVFTSCIVDPVSLRRMSYVL